MNKDEYRHEVGSLRLSEEFKDSLKAKLLEEYEKSKDGEEEPRIKMSRFAEFSVKYGKYAAVAAALVVVASTVGALSIGGLKSKKADGNLSAAQKQNTEQVTEQYGEELFDEVLGAPDAEAENEPLADEPTDTAGENEAEYDEPAEKDASDENIAPENADKEAPAEDDAGQGGGAAEPYSLTQGDPAEEQPIYSEFASPAYEGSYNGDDYINSDIGSAEGLPETVIETAIYPLPYALDRSASESKPEEYAPAEAPAAAPVPSFEQGSEPSGAQPEDELPAEDDAVEECETEDDPAEDVPLEDPADPVDDAGEAPREAPAEAENETEEAPREAPREAPVDDEDEISDVAESVDLPEPPAPAPEPETAPEVDMPMTVTLATEAREAYKDYYDYRSSGLPTDGIALVKFNIETAYRAEQIADALPGAVIDPERETMYRVNITYDYFNSEAKNADRLLINTGTEELQLEGRPVLAGEYIALVTEDSQGCLKIDPNLLYKVYSVRGVDIAYHVTSDLGAAIDPGDTNMGLSPSEASAYTTSANNPEKYEQKAEVNELTRYLRRNILRLEPALLDLSGGAKAPIEALTATYSAGQLAAKIGTEELPAAFPDPDGNVKAILEGMGAEIGSKTCSVITKDGSKAYFDGGALTGLDIMSDGKPFYFSVNGVSVGAELDSALGTLKITSEQVVDRSAAITLRADEADGGWTAELCFKNGVLERIRVRGE